MHLRMHVMFLLHTAQHVLDTKQLASIQLFVAGLPDAHNSPTFTCCQESYAGAVTCASGQISFPGAPECWGWLQPAASPCRI